MDRANLLVMPNVGAASIAFSLAKALSDGVSIGPILMGMNRSTHIVTPLITVRDLVNMVALAVVDTLHE